MTLIERKYECPTCVGTGEIESSDSTDESWWDCRRCAGTGKLADRRAPDPQLAGAVSLLREAHELDGFELPPEWHKRVAAFLNGENERT